MNTASLLENQAKSLPEKTALVCKGESLTFKEMDETINRLANYYSGKGIKRGTKTALFIRPSIELTATTFALFKVGAIPIFIDPGMGLKSVLKAVSEVAPDALVAIPQVNTMSRVFRRAFTGVKIKLNSTKVRDASTDESSEYTMYDAPEDEMAAIIFTSGGTGKPKGVIYTHKIFIEQTRLLQEMYSLTSDDVDCPCFSLFSFFTLAMGLTSYIPEMNHSFPEKTDPSAIVSNLTENKSTFAAGSPALWYKVADYCIEQGVQLPHLKSLVMFGAPVELEMHEKWGKILPNGSTYTPYGASESLPISNISGKYIMENTAEMTLKGAGVCVGAAVSSAEVRIYNGDEIIVSGITTTKEYYNEEEATRESKLQIDGKLWHKVGDVGYIDEENRIWFWGRKVHVVDLGDVKMYSTPCETLFNRIPGIKRTALIGPKFGGKLVPSLVIELKDDSTKMTPELLSELEKIRDKYEHTKPIERFFIHKSFPVDARHNIKIDRTLLTDWAESKFK